MLSEFELIARYFTRPTRHTVLGVGDDAALLAPTPGCELVASTDMLVEGVHFFAGADPESLGHKALAVNLSDLAAMGATPKWAMLSLALPRADEDWLAEFSRGFFALAEHYEVDLVGGDTTRGPRNICVQIMGEVRAGTALRRDGARAGDEIWVSGRLGDAAVAVAHHKGDLLLRGAGLADCLARLDRPVRRVALGKALTGIASAAIDISDGLVADLGHICARSSVGATVEFERLPCAAAFVPMRNHALVVWAMLSGGDDYELCFTASASRAGEIDALSGRIGVALTRVGRIAEGSGVQVIDAKGKPMRVERGGFDHFG
jgi:thiamine-monophosphate kinase